MKTKRTLIIVTIMMVVIGLLMVSLASAAPGDLDCEALANSTLTEPEGYAEQCMGDVILSPWVAESADPDDTAIVFELRNRMEIVSHLHNNFPAQTFIAAETVRTYFGWDFNETATVIYAHDFNTDQFGTVNPSTGAFTSVGSTVLPGAQTFSGLTIDPVTGDAYAMGTDGTISTLYSINLANGAATAIGNTGTALMIDLAMNCDGTIYGHDIGTDTIYTIDTATGTATAVGLTGLNANFAQGMDFDNADGTLYIYAYTGGGTNTYGTVNLANGSVTPLSVDNPLGEYEGASQTTCGGPVPSIEISKTPANQDVTYGGNAVFSITVTNTGNAQLDDVTVSDTLVPSCDNSIGTMVPSDTVTYGCVDVGVTNSYTNVVVVTSVLTNANPGPSASDSAVVTLLAPNISIPIVVASAQYADTVVTETFSIDNNGNLPLNWTLFEAPSDCNNPADLPWIVLSPTSGSTAGSSSTSIEVGFDSFGLSPGLYMAQLCIDSNDPDDPQVSLDLTLTVWERPLIAVSPTSFDETLPENEMVTRTLTISNPGDTELAWMIEEGTQLTEGGCGTPGDLTWLTVSPTSGATAPGGSSDASLLFDASGLTPGDYSGELCITSNAVVSGQLAVDVNLTVVQAEFFNYMPSIHREETTTASPIGSLPYVGLLVLPLVILPWRKRVK